MLERERLVPKADRRRVANDAERGPHSAEALRFLTTVRISILIIDNFTCTVHAGTRPDGPRLFSRID